MKIYFDLIVPIEYNLLDNLDRLGVDLAGVLDES